MMMVTTTAMMMEIMVKNVHNDNRGDAEDRDDYVARDDCDGDGSDDDDGNIAGGGGGGGERGDYGGE